MDARARRDELARLKLRRRMPMGGQLNIPARPDTFGGRFSEQLAEGAATAARAFGFERPTAEKLGKAYTTGMGFVPYVGAGMRVADELTRPSGDYGITEIGPTDVGPQKAAIFIGPNSSQAPSLFLKPAEEDLAAGRDPKAVWQEWGWDRGPDDKMRAEISDRSAALNEEKGFFDRNKNFFPKREQRIPMTDKWGSKPTRGGDPAAFWGERQMPLEEPMTAGNLFQHDSLFSHYPQLGDVPYNARLTRRGDYGGAWFQPGSLDDQPKGLIEAAGDRPTPEGFRKDPKDVVGVSLHELQHAVQGQEGFARGGNPMEKGMVEQGDKIAQQAKAEYQARLKSYLDSDDQGEFRTPEIERLAEIAETPNSKDEFAHLGYRSLRGETEARNVQTRRDFTGRERWEKAPWETEDIPRNMQLVRGQDEDMVRADRPLAMREAPPPTASQARDELTGLAAPAVMTGGNKALIERIYKAAEAQRTPEYPMAKEPVFDTSGDVTALTRELVPQRRIDDIIPQAPDLGGKLPNKGRIRQIADNEEAIANLLVDDLMKVPGKPLPFYATGPVIQGLVDKTPLGLEGANTFMRDWSGQGAATSPRTKTPPNLRNASYLLFRQAQGDPFTPAKHELEGNRPGFPMMGMHTSLGDEFARGVADPLKNTKPFSFRENWAGNMDPTTVDTHNIRKILDAYDRLNPGGLQRDWFTDQAAYDRYIANKGFPKEGELPVGDIQDKLGTQAIGGRKTQVEYPLMARPTELAARKLGIQPAQAQERLWFEGGPRTGLASPPMTIPDLLNAQIEATARATGLAPEVILRLWSQRQIPLASNEQPGVQGTSALA